MEQRFLSALLGMKIFTREGKFVGVVRDLTADMDLAEPRVIRVVFRRAWSRKHGHIPWESVAEVGDRRLVLRNGPEEMSDRTPPASEIPLRDFLLDKQIVDINGAKVERVNDLALQLSNGGLVVAQVDVGVRGVLRRLGFEKSVVRFLNWFFDYSLKERYIAWKYAQPLADPHRLRLQIPQGRLASLHPADLADIIEDMGVNERDAVVDSLEEDIIAEAIEEMDPKVQLAIMRGLSPQKAAGIIEEMSPDEAADLIADLPTEAAEGIFREMDHEFGVKVRGLLEHEEDEAGGLMTTQFLALTPENTIVEALAHIRKNAEETDVIYYIYVVDSGGRLLGVVNMRELLSHEIFTPLERIMTDRVIAAQLDDQAKKIAGLFAKYGFRAIPVVDAGGCIQGVVRFKALLELLAPHLG
jgi:sporulation protein YlmC with PRC-barrel domain/CBS domain-containing protein